LSPTSEINNPTSVYSTWLEPFDRKAYASLELNFELRYNESTPSPPSSSKIDETIEFDEFIVTEVRTQFGITMDNTDSSPTVSLFTDSSTDTLVS